MQSIAVDLRGRHLVIGMPAYDAKFSNEFQIAIVDTINACSRHGVKVTLAARCNSALIDKVRDEIVHGFLHKTDGSHLLMVDSDIVWEPADVLRLLALSDQHQFLVAPYCTKEDEPNFYYDLDPDENGKVKQEENGLIAVKTAPGGFSLISREAIQIMVSAYPELRYVAHRGEFTGDTITALHMMYLKDNKDGTRSRIGEDIAFCNRHRDCGGEIWMDPSTQLGHIGRKIYTKPYTEWLKARQPKQESMQIDSAA